MSCRDRHVTNCEMKIIMEEAPDASIKKKKENINQKKTENMMMKREGDFKYVRNKLNAGLWPLCSDRRNCHFFMRR